MIDIKAVLKEAEDDIRKEYVARVKTQLTGKMRALAAAKLVVANLERELEDCKLAISEGNV